MPISSLLRTCCVVAAALGAGMVCAQNIPIKNAGFEETDTRGWATGWTTQQHGGIPAYRYLVDREKPFAGKASVKLERYAEQVYGAITQHIDARPYVGKRVAFAGQVRVHDVGALGGGLYIRIDGPSSHILGFDFSSARTVGTHDWKPVRVVVEIPAGAHLIDLGVMLEDAGTVWADALTLSVTEDPVTAKPPPKVELPPGMMFEPAKTKK
jgi:hypothetical protein